MDGSEKFPYVSEPKGGESIDHVRLKNLAIWWLLNHGFRLDDIELEKPIWTHHNYPSGQTDVYASRDRVEAFVECETNLQDNFGNLSAGGVIPAREGKPVYVFTDSDVYHISFVKESHPDFPDPVERLRAFRLGCPQR